MLFRIITFKTVFPSTTGIVFKVYWSTLPMINWQRSNCLSSNARWRQLDLDSSWWYKGCFDCIPPSFVNKLGYFSGLRCRIALTMFQLLVLEASNRRVVFLEKCLLMGCKDSGVLITFVDMLSEYWKFFPFAKND